MSGQHSTWRQQRDDMAYEDFVQLTIASATHQITRAEFAAALNLIFRGNRAAVEGWADASICAVVPFTEEVDMRNRVVRTVDVPPTMVGAFTIRAEVIRAVVYAEPYAARVEFGVRYTVSVEMTGDVQAFERDLLAPFTSDDDRGNQP